MASDIGRVDYPPIVKVDWVDVQNVAGSWHDTDELTSFAKDEAYKVTSVGWRVYEDDLCVVLAGRYSPKTEQFGEHYGMVERIPKKIIDNTAPITNKELK
jgi:hypothetical protein